MSGVKRWFLAQCKELAVILSLILTPHFGLFGLYALFFGLKAGRNRPDLCMVLVLTGVMLLWAARNMYRFWSRNASTRDKVGFSASALITSGIMAWAIPQGDPQLGLPGVIVMAGVFGCWGGVVLFRQFLLWLESRRRAA